MTVDLAIILTFCATLFAAILRAATPLIFAALGGLVCELAGVINIALEGLMLIAAFFGVIVSALCAVWFPDAPAWLYPWVGCLAALLSAVILALILAFFHLELGADLIVAGVGINILASGLTVLLLMTVAGDKGSTATLTSYALPTIRIPFVSDYPFLGIILNGDGLQGHHILVLAAFPAAYLVHLMLYRTSFGLRLRSVGENPDAARQAGLSVKRLQYSALALSGVLAGLGGVFLSMGYLTLFQADMTAGRGYLALTAVFLGGRRPFGTLIAALCFGAFTVFAAQLGYFAIPSPVILLIPPIITIAALVLINARKQWRAQERIRNQAEALAQTAQN